MIEIGKLTDAIPNKCYLGENEVIDFL